MSLSKLFPLLIVPLLIACVPIPPPTQTSATADDAGPSAAVLHLKQRRKLRQNN